MSGNHPVAAVVRQDELVADFKRKLDALGIENPWPHPVTAVIRQGEQHTTCMVCAAVHPVGEDCPNYGNGVEHR